MENENKNASAKAHNGDSQEKGKQHKHKSYFVTPANAQAGSNDSQKVAQPTTAANQGTEKKSPEGQSSHRSNNHHHKNKRRHGNHGTNANANTNTPVNVSAASNIPQQNQASKESKPIEARLQSEQQNRTSSNKNSHHRNRHKKNVNAVNKDSNAAQVKSNTVEETKNIESNRDIFTVSALSPKKSDKLEKSENKKLEKFSDTAEYKKYSEYEEFSFEEIYGDNGSQTENENSYNDSSSSMSDENVDEPMVEVVGIRFKASGKTYYFAPEGNVLKTNSHAIVETARGLEYGEVAIGNTMVKESETVPPLRPVVRVATPADTKHHLDNKSKEDDAFRICNEKIIEHELDMKLIDAQYTFDNSKLLFYFTSAGRVDFRNLVKDLAGVFRTRIELRQIGIRDEAKMVGGLGLCGRPLCCSLFLTDFGQVSIKMAKEQNLSLNSSKISGICGRLMCCLRYEHETYEYEIKRTPPVDSLVRTVDGVGTVTEISPLTGIIKVRLNESPDVPPKSYRREDVMILKKKK